MKEDDMLNLTRKFITICFLSGLFNIPAAQQIDISGVVKDGDGKVVHGALVSLINSHLTDTTNADGVYHLANSVPVRKILKPHSSVGGPVFDGRFLSFDVAVPESRVRFDVISLSGKRIHTIFDKNLTKGRYEISPDFDWLPSQVYFLKVQVGTAVSMLKMSSVHSIKTSATVQCALQNDSKSSFTTQAEAAAADTIICGAVGYPAVKNAVSSLSGTYNLTLNKNVPLGTVEVIQTSKEGDRGAAKSNLVFAADDGSSLPTITIDTTAKFQTILGFGGAITEATVYNLSKIGPQKRNEILNECFNPYTGSGYTVNRTHINSCDFCIKPYSYDDSVGDKELKYFSIDHEKQWMIPTIKDAQKIPGAQFKLFASAWSPPAWMKTSGSMIGQGSLKTDCYDAWALYFSKFIKAYEAEGIKIWGITTQNEPNIGINYEACNWTPEATRDFIKNNLGPQMVKDNIKVDMMAFDDNKDYLLSWAQVIYGDSLASKYLWGIGYHWYAGDRYADQNAVHIMNPSKHLLATEACWWQLDKNVGDGGYEMWEVASRYGHSIIGDLNAWSEGWVEWNIALNQFGGPSHCYPKKGSTMTSSIIIDTTKMTVHYNPCFYYLRQFSKYIRPGAVRIGCTSAGSTLEATAVVNMNGIRVVEVLNDPVDTAITVSPVSFKIVVGNQSIKATIPGRSLMTFIF